MKVLLENMGYAVDPNIGIWSRTGYDSINYSDGDVVEEKIATIIRASADLSVLSVELKSHCLDWPSRYHLSGERANILRPFSNVLAGDILEIGAGCGAITRYLGELGGNVLALEGSKRRAAIARSRTRDLKNVEVLAESFQSFSCNKKFDAITLIGVLEYANLFVSGDDSTLAMLERVRQLLKDDGVLIIAIENQLGLKYFAGSLEDHISVAMYGIEGRYKNSEAQTFGKEFLAKKLQASKFEKINFLAPFPDYKLPVSIVTEAGFEETNFDASAFAWQSAHKDPQLPGECHFSLELAWPEIFKNKLALDMANSFLVVASPKTNFLNDSKVLAYHYSTNRRPAYCKETIFKKDENTVVVEYKKLDMSDDFNSDDNLVLRYENKSSAPYELGDSLLYEFVRIVKVKNWKFDSAVSFFHQYIDALKKIFIAREVFISFNDPYAVLPGSFVDAIPQNIIIRKNGAVVLIDEEWELREPLEVGFLIFRSILSLLSNIGCLHKPIDKNVLFRKDFMEGLLKSISLTLTAEDFNRYANLESKIREEVVGVKVNEPLNWWPDQLLSLDYLLDTEIQNLKQDLKNTEIAFSKAEKLATDRIVEINNLTARVANTDHALAEAQKLLSISRHESASLTAQLKDTENGLNKAQLLVQQRSDEILEMSKLLDGFRLENTGLREFFENEKNALSQKNKDIEEQLLAAKNVIQRQNSELIDVSSQLSATDNALNEVKALAILRLEEIEAMGLRISATDIAMSEAQSLALSRLEEINKLSKLHDDCSASLFRVEDLFSKEKNISTNLQKLLNESIILNKEKSEKIEQQHSRIVKQELYIKSIESSRAWRLVKLLGLYKGDGNAAT